ncbi:MAG TPA: Rieske (2Fe-2S) protein [Pseudonocardia sp.]|nr:Rieske (2Fe-2S) protein [Pseudonocardia sp.]
MSPNAAEQVVPPAASSTLRAERGFADVPGVAPGWWPVASGTELGEDPAAVSLGDTRIALFRDADGVAKGVLDRCPHRRMPLSLGKVVDGGLLQCGYHGWSFDGAGTCALIPNFRPGERPSSRIVVDAFAVREAGGLVLVHSRGRADALLPPVVRGTTATSRAGAVASGRVEVRAPHASVVAAMAFNPGRALGLGHLLGSGYEVVGPQVSEGAGTVCVLRDRLMLDLPRISTFDSAVKRSVPARIEVCPDTGLTEVTGECADGGRALVLVGLTPISPYRTVLRWRLRVEGRGGRALATAASAAWKLRTAAGRAAGAVEAVSDAAENINDPAIEILRQKDVSA